MVRYQSRQRFLQLAATGAPSVGASVASGGGRAVPSVDGPSVMGQTGTIITSHGDPSAWHRVSFETPFALTPVVITQPVTGSEPVSTSVRIRKVTRRGFEYRVEGGERQPPERLSYLALTRGVHQLGGSLLNADVGFVGADTTPTTVEFSHSFAERPVVFAQSQTHSAEGEAPVLTRIEVTGTDGFSVRLQGEQHPETVGYVAFEPGAGVLDPPIDAADQRLGRFEIATTTESVDDAWHPLAFEHSYDQPILLAGLQTLADYTTVHVGKLHSEEAGIRIEDPRSDTHSITGSERIGYAVFENEHLLYV